METNHTSSENFNDLVFENRNKAYGAYAIRSSYSDNVSKSLFIMLAITGSLLLIAFLFNKTERPIPKITEQLNIEKLFSIPVVLTPKPKPEPIPEKREIPKESPPKAPTPLANGPVVATDKPTIDHTPKPNENVISSTDVKTDGTDSSAFNEPNNNRGTIHVTASSNEPVVAPGVVPEFNGDLFKYLRSKIQYPFMALDNGTSGTVVLQFVVEKDGSIDEIKVLNPVADGCTEEAIRVVKSMPKWKPGKNGGEPVRVLFNLPVKFTIK